jgi:xylulokinase
MTPERGVVLGVDHETDRRRMIPSVLEGIALAFRDCLGALQAAGSHKVSQAEAGRLEGIVCSTWISVSVTPG